MSKQMRVSDNQFSEIGRLADDLGIKRSELLNLAIGLVRTIRGQKATSVKIVNKDKEVEVLLPVDMSE